MIKKFVEGNCRQGAGMVLRDATCSLYVQILEKIISDEWLTPTRQPSALLYRTKIGEIKSSWPVDRG
jgi:hypothetical protein